MRMPQIHTTTLLHALLRLGFLERDRKNSHIKVYDPLDPTRHASLPNHKSASYVPLGTLRNILKSTRVSVEDIRACI